MSESEAREQLENLQTDTPYVAYDDNGFIVSNQQSANQVHVVQGHRFVTIPELIKLLLSEPWRAIAELAPSFRMISANVNTKSKSVENALIRETEKTIVDFKHLLAR